MFKNEKDGKREKEEKTVKREFTMEDKNSECRDVLEEMEH